MRDMVLGLIKSEVSKKLEGAIFETIAELGIEFQACDESAKKILGSEDAQKILGELADCILKKM